MTSANTYGRQVVVPLTNKSGGGVIAGDVVIVDTTNNDAFTTTTSAATTNIVGVAQETIASNATGRVLIQGYAALVLTSASVTRGNYGATHTVAKQAADVGSSRVAGAFCKFLTGGTTPDAIVWNPDLGGASLTNPMTNVGDLIYGGTAGTPTRLADVAVGSVLKSGGVNTAPAWGAGVVTARASRVGGSYTLNSTSWANVDTGLDLTVAAATSDVLLVSLSGLWGAEAVVGMLDAATIVSAAVVNVVSGGGGASDQGVMAWWGSSATASGALNLPAGGSIQYVVQSGDISGGNVLLRLRYRTATAANKTLFGTTPLPFHWSVVNLRQ